MHSSKSWWKTVKPFLSNKDKQQVPPLLYQNELISDAGDKANILNNFFQEQTDIQDVDKHVPVLDPIVTSCLQNIQVSPDEVSSVLHNLVVGKAAGPDGVNNRILRELHDVLSLPLSKLFNYSLEIGTVPAAWKEANVTPVFKSGDPSLVSNYRPISLLSSLGKVLERIVSKHLYNHLHEHSILTPFQSGFVPGDSTTNQLTYLYNSFCKALDEGKEVRVIFCDISKAFDRVWHKSLLAKLQAAGITGSLLLWFKDYLSNRREWFSLVHAQPGRMYLQVFLKDRFSGHFSFFYL